MEIDKIDELKKHIYDKSNGLYYTLVGGCGISALKLPEKNCPITYLGSNEASIYEYVLELLDTWAHDKQTSGGK